MSSHIRSLPEILALEVNRIRSFGPEYAPYAKMLGALVDRLDTGRFHLAVLGQFKRGKSTLINALLGEALLPSSVIPLTAIPTLIFHGNRRCVRVRFQGDREDEVVEATVQRTCTTRSSNTSQKRATRTTSGPSCRWR